MDKLNITQLNSFDAGFEGDLEKLVSWDAAEEVGVYEIVRDILNRVKQEGGSAVVELTNRFDNRSASSFSELELPQSVLDRKSVV